MLVLRYDPIQLISKTMIPFCTQSMRTPLDGSRILNRNAHLYTNEEETDTIPSDKLF